MILGRRFLVQKNELLHKALEALYEYKTAPEYEKRWALDRLNVVLDEARKNTIFSRQQMKEYLLAVHYKDYFRRRRPRDNPSI